MRYRPAEILSAISLVAGLAGGPSVAGQTGKSGDMQSEPEISVVCRIEDPKATLAEDPCAIFQEVLAAAWPQACLTEAGNARAADGVLVIERASAAALTARIDWDGNRGQSLAMMRADRPLDRAAIAGFLERLLRASPRP